MTFLMGFARDERTLTLATLIALDLVLGVIAALRGGVFSFHAVGDFYRSNVVPYVLGYLVVYVVSFLGVAALVGPVWGEIAATVGVGPAVLNLGASIARNLVTIRTATTPVQRIDAATVDNLRRGKP